MGTGHEQFELLNSILYAHHDASQLISLCVCLYREWTMSSTQHLRFSERSPTPKSSSLDQL